MSRPRIVPTLFGYGADSGNVRVRSLLAAATLGIFPARGRGHRKTGSRKRSIGRILGVSPKTGAGTSGSRYFARRRKAHRRG